MRMTTWEFYQNAWGNQSKTMTKSTAHYDAVIVGAGFSGLYQLHCLRDQLGMSAVVVEKGEQIGGTWYWNRYPGARCDSESHAYCYSFSEELMQGWEYSERYPGPEEVCQYLDYVADRLDLKRDIRFNTCVTAADYDETDNLWHVHTENGNTYSARFLITAVGCLSSTNVPSISGLEQFKGDWYHTGQWPHDGVDFRGKRVGQIGTGSTGIQAAPVIAETAQQLTVFQRTANYSVPAHNQPLTAEFQTWVKQNLTEIQRTVRASHNGHPWELSARKALDVNDAERLELYEEAWKIGGLRFRATFQDLVADQAANDTAAEFIKNKIRGIVKDPRKAEILSDIDHPYAAKRPPIDSFYFETFNKDHVDVVDIRAIPIEEITQSGIRTSDNEYPLDIIVFATGFDAMTGSLLRLNITGKNAQTLDNAWSSGPRNYLGLQVAGFPNMFTITGPGSPSVLCNMPVAIEQHVEWIRDCIAYIDKKGVDTIEATESSMDDWVRHVNDTANATLLPKATHSWYLGANIPGKPRVFMPYPGGMVKYRNICDEIAADNYRGFDLQNSINAGIRQP